MQENDIDVAGTSGLIAFLAEFGERVTILDIQINGLGGGNPNVKYSCDHDVQREIDEWYDQ